MCVFFDYVCVLMNISNHGLFSMLPVLSAYI
jgi:hypothetical protein